MPTPVLYILLSAAAAGLLILLLKKRMLTSFLLNGVMGLLCCVTAVCLAPALGMRFSLNLFTGTVCLLLGPSGAAGLILVSLFWDL